MISRPFKSILETDLIIMRVLKYMVFLVQYSLKIMNSDIIMYCLLEYSFDSPIIMTKNINLYSIYGQIILMFLSGHVLIIMIVYCNANFLLIIMPSNQIFIKPKSDMNLNMKN